VVVVLKIILAIAKSRAVRFRLAAPPGGIPKFRNNDPDAMRYPCFNLNSYNII
jgi:hypothetical protein